VSGCAGALVVTWLGAGFIATGPIGLFTGVAFVVGIVTGFGIITGIDILTDIGLMSDTELITGVELITGIELIIGVKLIIGIELIISVELIIGIELIIGVGVIAIAIVGVVGMLIGDPDTGPPKFPGIPDSSARPSSDSTEMDAVLLDRRAPARRSFLVRSVRIVFSFRETARRGILHIPSRLRQVHRGLRSLPPTKSCEVCRWGPSSFFFGSVR
jgi:hypothetical protein